jgi:hypothetical protein
MVYSGHAEISRYGRAKVSRVHGMGATVPDFADGLGFQIIIWFHMHYICLKHGREHDNMLTI